VLWSRHDDLEDLFGDARTIWADWTTDLRGGGPINSGHHMAEERRTTWPPRSSRSCRCDHLRPRG
jgi:hypothetical protein